MTKKLTLLLALAGFIITGCDCLDCQQKDYFMVTPNALGFTEEVQQRTFTVSSSMPWTLVEMPAGFSYDITSGNAGTTKVTVTWTGYDQEEPVNVWAQASNGEKKPVELTVVLPYVIIIPDPLPDPLPILPNKFSCYVGAFWKANETGERIIMIKNINGTAMGQNDWKAVVEWLDPRWQGSWGNDRVVLANTTLAELTARGVYSADPGNPEDYQVAGSAAMISGTISTTNPDIIFRIGIKGKFTAAKGFKADDPTTPANDANYTSSWPARYAMVRVYYNNNANSFRIYLRQGEGSDYLMNPNDAINSGGMNSATRPLAARFAPYNLSALLSQLNVGSLAVNGGIFTDYPTQTGAFFQWASTTRTRYAWDAYSPNVTGWTNNYATTYWNTLYTNHETCPPDYHRPNDGPIDVAFGRSSALVSNSEFRQSLWLNPPWGGGLDDLNGANNPRYNSWIDNSVVGYYADGFFDRRQIVNAPGVTVGTNSSVAVLSQDIAHMGRLFFNPITTSASYGASLFVPISGLRSSTNSGRLSEAGLVGYLWSSSAFSSAQSAWRMTMYVGDPPGTGHMYADVKNHGYPIRCARNVAVL